MNDRPDYHDREIAIRRLLSEATTEYHNANEWDDEASISCLKDTKDKLEMIEVRAQELTALVDEELLVAEAKYGVNAEDDE